MGESKMYLKSQYLSETKYASKNETYRKVITIKSLQQKAYRTLV